MMAMTAHEAALYDNQAGGSLRKTMTSLTHKNLPLAMFLEYADMGFPAYTGATNKTCSNDTIITYLGMGIVWFTDPPEQPEPTDYDYEYRVDTDVITPVTLYAGSEINPDSPATVSFSINGSTYRMNNIVIPSGDSQIAWVSHISAYITVIVLMLFLVFCNPLAGGIALAGVLLSALFLHLLEARSRKNAPAHQKTQDDMVESSIEYLRGMQVVKAFKQEGVSIAGIRKAYNDSKKINIKIEVEYMPFNCLHLFSLKAASIAIVSVAALLTYNGSMELPTMLMLDMFSFMIFGSVEAMNNAAHVLEVIDTTLNKLDGIEHADMIDKDGKDISLHNTDITFHDVTFSYDKVPVLRNISFFIPQGSTTAIVGPSGSGKTTICNLIARFYDVDSGEVTVGGEDVRNMTCDSLLRNISMVFQKVYLFHDTIENNIRFGNPGATKEEIIEAAKKARCHDFITALPDGYETVIGEGGSTLSGGEKQRISIARAILKNAKIVILDEATASIDPENEHLIQQAISELTIGKTVIVIAHRLATIEHADQILVVDKGQVVQKGTHQQLVQQEGLYRRFITIREQAEGWSIA